MGDDKSPVGKAGEPEGAAGALQPGECTLAELPVGKAGVVINMKPSLRVRKKFADVGIVPGTRLEMEAHAPFGGLIRVKIMETSMALHNSDAANIVLKKEG